jgi:hypothetical protein
VPDREFFPVQDLLDQFKSILERGEKSIALDAPLDQREIQVRAKRQSLRIDLGAAADEDLNRKLSRIQFFESAENQNVVVMVSINPRKTELVVTFKVVSTSPFPVGAKDFGMSPDQASWVSSQNQVLAV